MQAACRSHPGGSCSVGCRAPHCWLCAVGTPSLADRRRPCMAQKGEPKNQTRSAGGWCLRRATTSCVPPRQSGMPPGCGHKMRRHQRQSHTPPVQNPPPPLPVPCYRPGRPVLASLGRRSRPSRQRPTPSHLARLQLQVGLACSAWCPLSLLPTPATDLLLSWPALRPTPGLLSWAALRPAPAAHLSCLGVPPGKISFGTCDRANMWACGTHRHPPRLLPSHPPECAITGNKCHFYSCHSG